MTVTSCALEPDWPESQSCHPLCQIHFLIYKMGIITVPVHGVVRIELAQVKCLLHSKSSINTVIISLAVLKRGLKTTKRAPLICLIGFKAWHWQGSSSVSSCVAGPAPPWLGLDRPHSTKGWLPSWAVCCLRVASHP